MDTTILAELGEKYRRLLGLRREFAGLFKRNIKEFVDPVTGFDLIKFDDEVACCLEGESTAEAIDRQFGEEAVRFVMSLI